MLRSDHPHPAFAIVTLLDVQGLELRQAQLATADHVLTEMAGSLFLFRRDGRERFLVDRRAGALRPLDLAGHREQVLRFRRAVGDLRATIGGQEEEVAGLRCRRFSLTGAGEEARVEGEGHVAAVDGLERTALPTERSLTDALELPGVLDRPDALVVRLSLRIHAHGTEQVHRCRVVSVARRSPPFADLDAVLRMRVAEPAAAPHPLGR